MKFIDLHCDTILECYLSGVKLNKSEGHIDIDKLKAGQALAQCFAIFVPMADYAEKNGVTETPYEYFQNAYKVYQREMAENAADIRPVLKFDDIEANKKAGFISSILTLEDSIHLDGKIERVDELYEKGVRIASLTWNYENSVAFPNSRDPEIMSKGLKKFGFDAVARMNELGIIVDVSHLSDGGFRDLVKCSRQPFIATHSCARALCNHPRNLTDDMLRSLGERGGIVGLNFCAAFVDSASTSRTTIEGLMRHWIHMADKAGVGALAFGSDFDGIDSELEFKDYAGMPLLADALSKHFKPSEVDAICHGNALRVFKQCWKG